MSAFDNRVWELSRKGVRYWREYGTFRLGVRLCEHIGRTLGWHLPKPISNWRAKQWQSQFEVCPKISIVVPIYRTSEAWLNCCVESVKTQYYENWELILVDDASDQFELTEQLQKLSNSDYRIKVVSLTKNTGIAGATNVGIENAKGEFIGFLDHDDELTLDALTWMVASYNRHPNALWFYSDEAKIPDVGKPQKPFAYFFKPAYSPEYLLSNMYTCHFSMYSTKLLREAGGLRMGFDGFQDHDLALRLSERVNRDQVVHVPRVLYYSRVVEGSTAEAGSAKPDAGRKGQKAVREALERRGLSGAVTSHPQIPTAFNIQFHALSTPTVRIIIPTFNSLHDLRNCLDSIDRCTRYPNYRVTIIDNRSDDPAVLAFLRDGEAERRFQVINDPRPFNHSRMHNDVIAKCDETYIVFMNNDVEILTEGWLEQMVATAEMDSSVAGVGALLLYPDRTVQHGGIYWGRCGVAGHSHHLLEEDEPGYFGQAHLLRETSGATAALLLMRRSAYEEVGGFDAINYPASFNDVDLWIRLTQSGYRCIYNPQVRAIHFASKSRKITRKSERKDIARFSKQWGHLVHQDPFHHPGLDPIDECFTRIVRVPVDSLARERFRCLSPTRALKDQETHQRAA